VTVADLNGRSRFPRIVKPRQIAMYLSKVLLGLSYPHIGRRFGGRDHTTPLYAIRKVARLVGDDRFPDRCVRNRFSNVEFDSVIVEEIQTLRTSLEALWR
jgi:chromosomal replication initiation ATPase DnaA